mgnify:FL=1
MKTNRRKFIETTITILGGIPLSGLVLSGNSRIPVRFGIFTDSHYADRESLGSRYYRESLKKLSECVDLMNDQKVDFLIELGDFKDQGNPPEESETIRFLEVMEKEFCRFRGPRFHVLGNHDHDSISKRGFLERISNTGFPEAAGYYSFTMNSVHFIVLDANYSTGGIPYNRGRFDWTDAYVPERQLRWLRKDLRRNNMPSVIFLHHRLDATGDNSIYGPGNAHEIRKILEDSGKVLIVFQGHEHEGALNRINNITYYTLKGMVEGSGPENNSYAIAEIGRDLTVTIKGFRRAKWGEFSN